MAGKKMTSKSGISGRSNLGKVSKVNKSARGGRKPDDGPHLYFKRGEEYEFREHARRL